jgi:WD40 repeat protein/tRNA A-37 threonylcarbamoyl transferase component Bud32
MGYTHLALITSRQSVQFPGHFMSSTPHEPSSREERVNEAIAAYLEAVERGESPDREKLLADHPDIAAELNSFIANQAQFQQDAGSLRPVPTPAEAGTPADEPTRPVEQRGVPSPKDVVRYFGDYELLEEIARGGMGVVFKARQVTLNRIVAVKMILSGRLASPQDVERFHTEAEAAAKLDHPGIVPIYEVGQDDGQHYFSMGFVDGQSLSARIAIGPLPDREAAVLVRTVAEAVQYAHEKGVIHRDLKPGNILLDLQGQPRVTDFGLAKLTESVSELTATGQILGTPGYMPPEQAAAAVGAVGRLSDVYSLGAILYCVLTGRPPFQAATPIETLLQVQQQEPVPPRQLNPSIPLDLDTIVLKCLDKSPSRRYASAQALADELRRFLEGRPVVARRIGQAERLRRWCRRNRAVAALLATIAICLSVGTTVSLYFAIEASNRATAEAFQRGREADARRAAIAAQTAAERETRASNYNLYVSRIQIAQRSWEDGDTASARRILESAVNPHESGRRGPEWLYLWGLTEESLRSTVCDATAGPVFSLDGKRVATGHPDHVVRIFHADTLEEVQRLSAGGPTVAALAFTPDGRSVRTACLSRPPGQGEATGEVHEWNLDSGLLTRSIQVPREVLSRCWAAEFSPDAHLLALSPGQHSLLLWDVVAGQPLHTLQTGIQTVNTCFTFSPDGKVIAMGDGINRQVIVWDVATGNLTRRHPVPIGIAEAIAFSSDGRELLAGTSDGHLVAWDVETGQQRYATRATDGAISALAFRKDGVAIVLADRKRKIVIAEVGTGRPTRTIRGHLTPARALTFYPDGRRVLSADREQLHAWDSHRDQGVTAIHIEGSALAFSPDGRSLAVCAKYETDVFDGYTGDRLNRLGAYTGYGGFHVASAFGSDDRQLAILSGDGSVRLWDAHTGIRRHVFGQRKANRYYKGSARVVFDRPHNRVVAWLDGEIKVWDAATGLMLSAIEARHRPTSLAISPDGSVLVAGQENGDIQFLDLRSGGVQMVLAAHIGTVRAATFSPDGRRLATAGNDRTIRLWDTATRSVLHTLEGHAASIAAVAFSPDGSRIATASDDTTVRLWDPDTGCELVVLRGHSGEVSDVAFRPDGAALASVGADLRTLIWHFPDPSAPSDRLAEYLAARLKDEEVLIDAVAVAAGAQEDWPGALRDSVRAASAKSFEAANLGPRLWRFVRRGGDLFENAAAARAAEVLHRRFPTDPIASRCLAYAFYHTGQFENALATIDGATGADEEALRVLANLALKRIPEARRSMADLLAAAAATDWADGPLAPTIAVEVKRAFLKVTPDEVLGDLDDLIGGAITLLSDDLDHYYSATDLRIARGIILGRRGELLVQKKALAAAEAMLLESYRVLVEDPAAETRVQFRDYLLGAIYRLAHLYEAMERPEEAAKWKEKYDEAAKDSDQTIELEPTAGQPEAFKFPPSHFAAQPAGLPPVVRSHSPVARSSDTRRCPFPAVVHSPIIYPCAGRPARPESGSM